MKFIPQCDTTDCGFACLKMLLCHLHHDSKYLYLPNEKEQPYSFLELKEIAAKYRLVVKGYRYQCGVEGTKIEKFPFITALNQGGKNQHCVLVTKITNHYVRIIDPANGVTKLSVDDYNHQWNGETLEISHFQKYPCPIKSLHLLDVKKRLVLAIIQFFSGAAFVAGSLFIDRNISLFVPLAFFFLCILLEITKKLLIFKLMQQMDDKYLLSFDNKRNNDYYSYYLAYNEVKKNIFLFPINIILSLVSICLVILVILLNGTWNLLYVILPILLALFDAIVLSPQIENATRKASYFEHKIKESRHAKTFRENALKANEIAYRTAKKMTIFYYVSGCLILINVIGIMAANETISLPHVVFYFSICFFIKQNLTSVLKSLTAQDTLKVNKVRLSNLLRESTKTKT